MFSSFCWRSMFSSLVFIEASTLVGAAGAALNTKYEFTSSSCPGKIIEESPQVRCFSSPDSNKLGT